MRPITDLLRELQLGPWLDRLESGLDTVRAPWGQPVSGGELQRLSVAAASAHAVTEDRLGAPDRSIGW